MIAAWAALLLTDGATEVRAQMSRHLLLYVAAAIATRRRTMLLRTDWQVVVVWTDWHC
jgi:hypothetical protein